MKKTAFALFFVAIGMASSTFAAPIGIPEDGNVTSGEDGNCVLLAEPVKINLSSNVAGALNCDEATNTVSIGTCHNAGSRLSSLKCAAIGQNEDGTTKFNDDNCNAEMVTKGESIEGTPDFRGFFAQTSGGSVAPGFLGGSCTEEVLTGHANLTN